MGDIIRPTFNPSAPVAPRDVLLAASEYPLQTVFVIGIDLEGKPYHASSTPDPGLLMLMLERARFTVLQTNL